MNRTFAARGVSISLVVLVGLAALIWWLIASGRIDGSLVPGASNVPAEQSKPSASAPAPEKPASKIEEATKTLKDLGDRIAPSAPASTDPAPSFDVARVASDGEAVVAGRAVANSAVELLVDGKVHDRTTADSSGAFVFIPKPLPPGKYDLTLRATAPDGKVMVSKSPVAIALVAGSQKPVAELPAPKSPAIASVAPQSPAAGPASKPRDDVASRPVGKEAGLRIESVEPEAGGGLFVSGRATPGSRIRLYMNDGYIAMGTASPEGRVSFSIQSGVRPGDYRIRLEQMGPSDSVVSRVEIPFRAPATVAAAPSVSPAPAPSVPAKAPEASATPDSVIAARQPQREPAPAASIVSPPQAPVAADQKPAAPAAASSQPSPSQPSPSQSASPGSAPKDPASGPAQKPLVRSAESGSPVPAPAASAQQPKTEASSGPVQMAAPAAAPDTRAAQIGKADSPTSQPPASSPAVAAPASEPKAANMTSPRIAERTKDRRDAVIIPSIDTRLIIPGDNLWRISEATYGLGQRYTIIFGANRDQIRNPNLIYPGQIFVLPKSGSKQ